MCTKQTLSSHSLIFLYLCLCEIVQGIVEASVSAKVLSPQSTRNNMSNLC